MEFPLYAESGFRGRKFVYIKNPDGYSNAYTVQYRAGLADIVVHRGGPEGPIVGRIDFHKWSNYVELWFENNVRVEMRRSGMFSNDQIVSLPAAPATSPFAWGTAHGYGSKLAGGNLKLEDSKGTTLALYARKAGWSSNGIGVLTLTVSGLPPQLQDQIFVTFIAIEERRRRQRQAGAASAGASAGAAGGC